MASLLTAVIFLAFISLGLPDALLGSAWPTMQQELNAPLSFAGVITMVIAGGTIVSSLMSDRLTRRMGAGLVTACSVLMTAVALMGFSLSTSGWVLLLWAIPYGLGAGAVDAALNNYVAIHYSSKHMSWLHCCWGLGASLSPFIMGYCLTAGKGWPMGYSTVSIIQFVLTAMLFLSLPLWKNRTKEAELAEKDTPPKSLRQILGIKGVPYVLLCFFGYCGMETTAGLWASSYMVLRRGVDPQIAANFAALFYVGITVGRFINGFVANRYGDRTMIRIGEALAGISILALLIPSTTVALFALVALGIGSAPIYPCIIHATPLNFGVENSQAIVGVQMASAYVGSTFMPPLFGLIAQHINISLYPVFLLVFTVLMAAMSERLNRTVTPAADGSVA